MAPYLLHGIVFAGACCLLPPQRPWAGAG